MTESDRGFLLPTGAVAWGRPVAVLVRAPAAMLARWLTELLIRIGDWVFAMNDQEAGWRGWRVERRQAGLGRRYRDPQFDTLSRCPECRGTGTITESRCARCSGTGRIVLARPPSLFDRDG